MIRQLYDLPLRSEEMLWISACLLGILNTADGLAGWPRCSGSVGGSLRPSDVEIVSQNDWSLNVVGYLTGWIVQSVAITSASLVVGVANAWKKKILTTYVITSCLHLNIADIPYLISFWKFWLPHWTKLSDLRYNLWTPNVCIANLPSLVRGVDKLCVKHIIPVHISRYSSAHFTTRLRITLE